MTSLTDEEKSAVYDEFKRSVNMTKKELSDWLDSDESKSVGIKKSSTNDKKASSSGEESTGHESGRRIVTILDTKKADLIDDDYSHMKKVNGYVKRHIKQKPQKEPLEDSRWRYSLMNWGNDPLK